MAYKRTSRTAKGTGVRTTTTHNRKTGTTRTTSIPNGKNARTTYTTNPKGQTKVTRTYKDASGYITRTSNSLMSKTPKVKKPPKPKAYRPPKPPRIKIPKTKSTRSYSRGTRRRRSTGQSGCAIILFAPLAIFALTYFTSAII